MGLDGVSWLERAKRSIIARDVAKLSKKPALKSSRGKPKLAEFIRKARG